MMGSCFSTEVGKLLIEDGFDVCLNPFGILFNPASICSSISRLESRKKFTIDDVIPREGKYVSYFHHGSFARETPEAFLENANTALKQAADFFAEADTVILTLGTSWVFRHIERGYVVSNCHKVPAREFSREFLPMEETAAMLGDVVSRHPEKKWIFTVSPIRHMADGIHGNQISKSSLLLAIERLRENYPQAGYFEAYEIMTDTLRDWSWYRENGTHPTEEAVKRIYDAFLVYLENEKDIDSNRRNSRHMDSIGTI